jgi:hypothetical protein
MENPGRVQDFSGKDCFGAQALNEGSFVISCGGARLVSLESSSQLNLGRLVLGYDKIASDSSGTKLLLLQPYRDVPVAQRARELGEALITLGMVVVDEDPNAITVRVLNSHSGKACLTEQIHFRPYGSIPVASISPDGSRIAIGVGNRLRLLEVPHGC